MRCLYYEVQWDALLRMNFFWKRLTFSYSAILWLWILDYSHTRTLQLVKSHSSRADSWKSAAIDRMDSALGCLQIFNGKSLSSMSAGTLQLYFLHVTLLNLPETGLRRHIMNCDTSVVSVRIRFRLSGPSHESVQRSHTQRNSIARLRTLKEFHESIDTGSTPLKNIAFKGLPFNHVKARRYFST